MSKFILPYNPNWKIEFERIRRVIETELGDLRLHTNIQHVGSTSVPGLSAKPILDIDIIIEDKNLLNKISSLLEKIGYRSIGEQGINGRFAFIQNSEFTPITAEKNKWQSHHLYVCYADSLALKNHILFQDMLRKDKKLLEMYSELKRVLTGDFQINREAYAAGKTEFIISVLARAGLSEMELEEIKKANA
jgi:GrpB-like predicted nucleotidyltransferase (UPF0157 family)